MQGAKILELKSVGSTNQEALTRAANSKSGAPLVEWVVAAEQTNGRGRHGRHWHSPPGNLYVTRLIRTGLPVQQVVELTLVAGIAVYDAVHGLLDSAGRGGKLALKWPNDLLAGSAKIAGILIQTEPGEAGLAVAIGIGINVKSCPDGEPVATSMRALGWQGEPGQVFQALARSFESWKGAWGDGAGFAEIRRTWLDRSIAVGAAIRVRLGQENHHGTFEGLDETGSLLLKEAGGAIRKITTGDVFLDQPCDPLVNIAAARQKE